jgi:DNA-binding NarL/FixJ family response regulator
MSIRILDVGQCGFDGPRMADLFRTKLSAEVDQARTADEAKRQLASAKYDVVLVNRVMAADGSSGLDLIADLVKHGNTTPCMLVSDMDDAQEQAVKAGAVRGFGKANIEDQATLDLIKSTASGGKGS